MSERLRRLVSGLAGHRVIILGDIILDEYVIGDARRISREAPIPVLELRERRDIPGGAANPAVNVATLGSMALPLAIIGQDDAGQRLRAALAAHQIDTHGLVVVPDRPTTLKTRILAQMGLRFPQQVARIDTLSRAPISAAAEAEVLRRLDDLLPQAGAVLVSDYQGGLLTSSLVAALQSRASVSGVVLAADAQGHLEKYVGFDLVKCNADDAAEFLRRELRSDEDFAAAGLLLFERLAVRQAMVITRGADGATLAQQGGVMHCPSPRVSNVFDTVGAGDTWIAVMTLAHLTGAAADEAVMLANYASGIVVQHVGNYAPAREELLHFFEDEPNEA